MTALVLRFVIGGLVVSFFAIIGDVLRPKSLAGIFSAAPSVALGTIALSIKQDGAVYAAQEAGAMLFGAAAFLVYAALASFLLRRKKLSALMTSVILMPVWFALALGTWALLGRGL